MDDAGDAIYIDATSFIRAAELLTRKLAIQLGSTKHILPAYLPALQYQPGHVPTHVTEAAVRLPDVDGAAVGSSSISILRFPHSSCGPPPDTEKMFPSSRLHMCSSSLSFTSLQPSQVEHGSLLSNRLPDSMLLHMEALQRASVDLAILDARHPSKAAEKPFSVGCEDTTLAVLQVPYALEAGHMSGQDPSIFSAPHMCSSSLSFTSLQPSQARKGSALSNRLADPMLLHMEALQRASVLAILDPLHHVTLPKMQKPSCSFPGWPSHTRPWLLSKRNMPLWLDARPSKIAPPSCLDTHSISLSFTSLQPSQVEQGSLLSNRLADPMMLHKEAPLRAPMDLAILDPWHHATLLKLQRPSCSFSGWPAHTLPWLLSKRNMPLWLDARPSKISPPSCLDTHSISLSFTSLQPSQVRASVLAILDPLHHVTLPKMQKPSCSFPGWPSHTRPWLLSKRNMPLRLAARASKIAPPSCLDTHSICHSFTSLQPSQEGEASLLSNQLADPILLHKKALQFASVDAVDPFHRVTLPKLQKPSCSFSGWPAHTRPWLLSKRNIPLRLAARPSKIASRSCLDTCSISLSFTFLQPSQGGKGSLLSNWLPDPILLHKKALQFASVDSVDPFHLVTLPKLQKPSCSFSGWPSHTRPWLLSKRNIPLRLAARPSKIAPPSCLDTHSIFHSFTSLQPSQEGEASLLSSQPPHVMLLYKEALQHTCVDLVILGPLHHGTPPKIQTLFSVSAAKRPLWRFSKGSMPLRLATCLGKILPSSRLHTCTSSPTFTSLQPSQGGKGSALSNRLADPMLLHMEALQRASVLAILDPLHHVTLPKMQKPSCSFPGWPSHTRPWLLSKRNMPLRLPARPSKIAPPSCLDTHSICHSFTSLQPSQEGEASLLSSQPPHVMLLCKEALPHTSMDSAILDPLHHVTPSEMQKNLSVSAAKRPLWRFSKGSMPLRLATCLGKILPSSRLHTCTSSPTFTSLQPSQGGKGSALSNRLADPMLLHIEALQRASVLAILDPLHHVTPSEMQKNLFVSAAKRPLWQFSKGSMPLRLATCLGEILPSSRLHTCTSSPTFTSLQPSQGGKGSVLSNRLADPMFAVLDPLHHVTLPKMQKPSCSFPGWPSHTRPWLLSKRNMPLRLAARASKIAPPSCLDTHSICHSFTSLQPSQEGEASLLSSQPPHVMLLCKEALPHTSMDSAILDPLHHVTLPKMQKPSCSFPGWPSHTRPWLLSKRNMPLRLPARPSKIAPPSCLDTHSICHSFTSLQPSQEGEASLLSSQPPHVMLLCKEALPHTSMDSAILDPLHHVTPSEMQKNLSVSAAKRPLWRFSKGSMPLRLATCLGKILPSSRLHTCTSSPTFTSLQPSQGGKGSALSNRLADPMLLHMEALQRASVLAILDPLHHVTPSEMQKNLSVSAAKRPLWQFSKGSMPLRLATCLSKIPPSSWLLSERCKLNMPLRLAKGPSDIVSSSEILACASSILASAGASAVQGQGGRVGSVHGLCCLCQCLLVAVSVWMYGSALKGEA